MVGLLGVGRYRAGQVNALIGIGAGKGGLRGEGVVVHGERIAEGHASAKWEATPPPKG